MCFLPQVFPEEPCDLIWQAGVKELDSEEMIFPGFLADFLSSHWSARSMMEVV